jgi:predicted AlkP superfamily phosphohydrolase/phosphomutase
MDYRIDVDTMKARQDYDFLFQDLYATLEGRKRATDFLWDEMNWDLFIVVVTGTDRLMHFLWEAYENETHPYHQAFLDYYGAVDRFVGHVFDRYSALTGDNTFYMLSDHGFTAVETEVYLNRWLQEHGYLKYKKDDPETIMDIGEGSAAFAMDPSRIYVNLKGKYPMGTIDPGDYQTVRSEIRTALEKLTFTQDRKVAKKVYAKEDLYHGPFMEQAPDLVVLSEHGYDVKGQVRSKEVFGRSNLVGMHTQDDAFFFGSDGIACRSIFDAKEIIRQKLTS